MIDCLTYLQSFAVARAMSASKNGQIPLLIIINPQKYAFYLKNANYGL
jgi:hypothetical protein